MPCVLSPPHHVQTDGREDGSGALRREAVAAGQHRLPSDRGRHGECRSIRSSACVLRVWYANDQR